MKARHRRAGSPANHLAALVAVCLCAPAMALAAAGGTIHFTGMIVAPPFDVTPVAGTALTASGGVAGSAAQEVSVTYAAEPNSAPVANVSLVAVGNASSGSLAPVAARFTDTAGHELKPDEIGAYHLSGSGGVLKLSLRGDYATSVTAAVTVVTSYQ